MEALIASLLHDQISQVLEGFTAKNLKIGFSSGIEMNDIKFNTFSINERLIQQKAPFRLESGFVSSVKVVPKINTNLFSGKGMEVRLQLQMEKLDVSVVIDSDSVSSHIKNSKKENEERKMIQELEASYIPSSRVSVSSVPHPHPPSHPSYDMFKTSTNSNVSIMGDDNAIIYPNATPWNNSMPQGEQRFGAQSLRGAVPATPLQPYVTDLLNNNPNGLKIKKATKLITSPNGTDSLIANSESFSSEISSSVNPCVVMGGDVPCVKGIVGAHTPPKKHTIPSNRVTLPIEVVPSGGVPASVPRAGMAVPLRSAVGIPAVSGSIPVGVRGGISMGAGVSIPIGPGVGIPVNGIGAPVGNGVIYPGFGNISTSTNTARGMMPGTTSVPILSKMDGMRQPIPVHNTAAQPPLFSYSQFDDDDSAPFQEVLGNKNLKQDTSHTRLISVGKTVDSKDYKNSDQEKNRMAPLCISSLQGATAVNFPPNNQPAFKNEIIRQHEHKK